jgi:hypothetical protein
MHPGGLAAPSQDVNFVRVLTDIQSRLQQPASRSSNAAVFLHIACSQARAATAAIITQLTLRGVATSNPSCCSMHWSASAPSGS